MLRNKKKKGCYFLLLAILFACGCAGREQAQFQEIEMEDTKSDEVSETPQENQKEIEDTSSTEGPEHAKSEEASGLFVHICGAVKNPGVYEMSSGSRIYEGIQKAGGMTAEASADALNQAELLQDGQRIYVPTREEAKQPQWGAPDANADPGTAEGKINLNTAAKEELMTLSGIGESKADSIIRYREENGGFQSIDDVTQIEGIKEGVFRKIKDQITV